MNQSTVYENNIFPEFSSLLNLLLRYCTFGKTSFVTSELKKYFIQFRINRNQLDLLIINFRKMKDHGFLFLLSFNLLVKHQFCKNIVCSLKQNICLSRRQKNAHVPVFSFLNFIFTNVGLRDIKDHILGIKDFQKHILQKQFQASVCLPQKVLLIA